MCEQRVSDLEDHWQKRPVYGPRQIGRTRPQEEQKEAAALQPSPSGWFSPPVMGGQIQ
jgi:hypothetical protein